MRLCVGVVRRMRRHRAVSPLLPFCLSDDHTEIPEQRRCILGNFRRSCRREECTPSRHLRPMANIYDNNSSILLFKSNNFIKFAHFILRENIFYDAHMGTPRENEDYCIFLSANGKLLHALITIIV